MRRFVSLLFLASFVFPLAAFERQSNEEYRARRQRLAAKLERGIALVFANIEENDSFRQNDEFLYLTGWNEPGGAVLITPTTEVLFLPQQNAVAERWTGPKLNASSPEVAKITGFDRVENLDKLRDELAAALAGPGGGRIYTDVSQRGPTPSTIPLQWLTRANAFPRGPMFTDVKPLIAELRLVKDAGEIAMIRKAVNATVEAHKIARRSIHPGMAEREMAGIVELEFRRGGCEANAFPSIVGSGANSTVLHYMANSGTMANGDVVVIDIGAECARYASDVTRTLAVNGRFTPRQKEIYDIVLGAQNAAVAAFKAGESTLGRGEKSLHKVAMDYISARNLGQYFIHGLTHYVGLDVHDAGSGTVPLAPGMVFTIEPGIYIPEERIGVRIEDTYLVREDGTLECLSCGAPK